MSRPVLRLEKRRPPAGLLASVDPSVDPSDDVTAVPARYVACRSLRHAWEPSDKVLGSVDVGLTIFACICLRCTTERVDGIDGYGRVKNRRYRYPEGYLRKKGQAKLLPTDYRLQLLSLGLAEITLKRQRR